MSTSNHFISGFARFSLCFALVWAFSTNIFAANILQISGTVKDSRGSGISNITVSASSWWVFGTNQTLSAQTDENGFFSFEVVPAMWQVQVEPSQLEGRNYRIPSGTYVMLTLTDREVNFVLLGASTTSHLRGHVCDPLSHPLSKVAVTAQEPSISFPRRSITDQNGAFDFGVFEGNWKLGATASSPTENFVSVSRTVEVVAGEDQNDIVMIAHPASAQLSGEVIDSLGNRLAQVFLSAEAISNNVTYSQSTQTDSSGHFQFSLFETNWLIKVGFSFSTPGYKTPHSQYVNVKGSNQVIHFLFEAPTNHLRGRVIDNTGAPMASIDVSGYTEIPELFSLFQARTDTNGNFDVAVYAGVSTLWVSPPNGYLAPNGFRANVVNGSNQENITLILERATTELAVSLMDSSSNPIVNIQVPLSIRRNGLVYDVFAFTDMNGNARIPLFEGDWSINALGLRFNLSPRGYLLPSDEAVAVDSNNVTLKLVAEPIPFTTRLRGSVVDETGHALPQVDVSFFSLEPLVVQFDEFTDDNGAFDVPIFGGEWWLNSIANYFNNVDLLWPAINLIVEDGVAQDDVILVARKTTGLIAGRLTDATGQAVPGIYVSASSSVGDFSYQTQATTDEDGNFSLPVFDGDWEVNPSSYSLNPAGYQSLPAQAVSVLEGAGFVDFVVRPIVGDGRIPKLSSAIATNGEFHLKLTSQTEQAYRMEVSSDLVHWSAVATNYSFNGSSDFVHRPSSNCAQGFYRAVWLPGF